MSTRKRLIEPGPVGLSRLPGVDARARRAGDVAATNRGSTRVVKKAAIEKFSTTSEQIVELQRAINEVIDRMQEVRLMDK